MTTTQQKRCAYCSQPMQTYRICPAREIHGPCVPKLTAPPPGAGGDVGARSDDVMRHDFPALQQFHTKHAMGSLAAPSCLCCGRSTQGVEIGVQHMELPGIVICKPCKDATAPGDAGGSVGASAIYVCARECDQCGHAGINDEHPHHDMCSRCEWSGPAPTGDLCPLCGSEGTICAACPECGGRYRLLAEKDIKATP